MRAAIAIIVLLLAAAIGYYAYQEGLFATAPEAPAPDAPPPEAVQDELSLPRFDIVRVSRGGFAVIAGTGEPGATIEVLANDAVIDTVTVGPDGAWASQVETPLAAGPVELSLRQRTQGEAIVSEDTIVIYVPEGPDAGEGGAPIVLRTMPGGATELLQRADDPADSLGPLAVETIDYDASNAVIFAGSAEPGATVQLTLDGVPLGAPTTADEAGRWEVSAEVPPGRYALRAVQYGPDGQVAYAVQVPFERPRDEQVVRAGGGVVVQPGNSLWVISREVYGEGRQYTIIFAANMDQIEDPDLIYPGQVIAVPEERGRDGQER